MLGAKNESLIIDPTRNLKIDTYPDAKFSGLYIYEDSCDPVCVRIRTGDVINVAGCHMLWQSQLQTEIATSTI